MASLQSPNSALPHPGGDLERAELRSVLESASFKRSPKLSRLLSYICEKHFAGEGSQITEYGIAQDVLDRDADFNPQADAVVRVDAHHLRKRLAQYYAAEGSGHELVIVIPTGRYAPHFLLRAALETKPVVEEPRVPGESPAAGVKSPWRSGWRWLALALVVAAAALYATVAPTRRPGVRSQPAVPPVQAGLNDGIRILAGDRTGNYLDAAGRTWLADRYFKGGETFRRTGREILRTPDPEIFRTGREGQFAYEIPLDPGVYELRLYFAETGFASEGLRGVNLAINGIPHGTLDVASDAGGINTAVTKIYTDISPARDGLLHLTFLGTDPSFLNALEIVRGRTGKMNPLRFTTRDTAWRDHQGRLWLPEVGVAGGRRSARIAPISGATESELYITQRFGHFNYSISVAERGLYTVTLHFAETWFGLPNSPGGIGKRIFDVYCNGTTLLENFDILKDTGGIPNRALVRVFERVHASPQGKLEIEFVPVANYATVSAIEVEQE